MKKTVKKNESVRRRLLHYLKQVCLLFLEPGTFGTLKAIHKYLYMKGIDHSYYYEGYVTFKTEEL